MPRRNSAARSDRCRISAHANAMLMGGDGSCLCVCGGVGAGLDRVQRLQGHDAGLLRRGGPQVLPLPVPQHLPGGSPCPPVVLLFWMEGSSVHGCDVSAAKIPGYNYTHSAIHTSSIFIQSKMNCIISWYAELAYVYVCVHCYCRSEDCRTLDVTSPRLKLSCDTKFGQKNYL
jgi:hypothetical protein